MNILRIVAAVSIAIGSCTAAAVAATCDGPNPAITSVVARPADPAGGLTHYQLTATVTNLGTQSQANNVLQFVDIYMAGDKLDAKGVPPLQAGQSYTFTYSYARASDAGPNTTHLKFAIDMTRDPGVQNCNPTNGQYVVTF